jgi:hypothetical protein
MCIRSSIVLAIAAAITLLCHQSVFAQRGTMAVSSNSVVVQNGKKTNLTLALAGGTAPFRKNQFMLLSLGYSVGYHFSKVETGILFSLNYHRFYNDEYPRWGKNVKWNNGKISPRASSFCLTPYLRYYFLPKWWAEGSFSIRDNSVSEPSLVSRRNGYFNGKYEIGYEYVEKRSVGFGQSLLVGYQVASSPRNGIYFFGVSGIQWARISGYRPFSPPYIGVEIKYDFGITDMAN